MIWYTIHMVQTAYGGPKTAYDGPKTANGGPSGFSTNPQERGGGDCDNLLLKNQWVF